MDKVDKVVYILYAVLLRLIRFARDLLRAANGMRIFDHNVIHADVIMNSLSNGNNASSFHKMYCVTCLRFRLPTNMASRWDAGSHDDIVFYKHIVSTGRTR